MRDMPARHRSLQSVFIYSWRLLSGARQRHLACLALFRQPFTVAGATAVANCTPADLQVLVRQSWLRELEDGRFLFHELLRSFAHDKLMADGEGGNYERAREQFATFQLDFAAQQAARFDHDLTGTVSQAVRQTRLDLQQGWLWAMEMHQYNRISTQLSNLSTIYRQSALNIDGLQLMNRLIDLCHAHLGELSSGSASIKRLWCRLHVERLSLSVEGLDSSQVDERRVAVEKAIIMARKMGEVDIVNQAYLVW